MPFDVTTPQSPGWWLVRLVARLQAERPDVDRLESLFRGDHPLPDANEESSEGFKTFQKLSRSNYLALVVEAVLERLRIAGFRAGADDAPGDDASWSLWQSARLDADATLVHRTMLSARRAYVILGRHPRRRDELLITPEHPSQVTAESWPDDRRDVRAALKLYVDTLDGREHAFVYLATGIYHFRSPRPYVAHDISRYDSRRLSEWEVLPTAPNPTAPEVPVVEFANRPSMLGHAVAEFEDVVDIQNRINQTLMHRLVAEKYGSFRQTAILNLALEEDEEGAPVVPELPSGPGASWLLDGENLSMWQSAQTSTADILSGVEADIRDLAAITRTPPHYLLNSIVNASGDALKSAETGLVAKVREHMAQTGEAWEQVIHLAHVLAGTERTADRLEVLWRDPESRSLSELSDAVQKQMSAGVPWRKRMEVLGYSPTEIDRMETQRMEDALAASLAAPPAPATPSLVPAGASQTAPEQQEAPEAAA